MILDFTEIPVAKGGSPTADTFEQFAAELLKLLGYQNVEGPSRGPDGGRDLTIEEVRRGISRDSKIQWLVSCKHYVHSGKAVGVNDELNISDRINQHQCSGFLGVYSTLPTTALEQRLKQQPFEYQIITPEQIEKILLDNLDGIKLAERFFPGSMRAWSRENPQPADLFSETFNLNCDCCGRDLLNGGGQSIYIVFYRYEENRRITSVYFVCKGDCDRRLTHSIRRKGEVDAWEDIDDLKIPIVFLRKMFGVMNSLRDGEEWEDEAYEKFRHFLTGMASYCMRSLTQKEKETVQQLKMLWDTGLF